MRAARPGPEHLGRDAEGAGLSRRDRHRARRAGRGALPHARPVGARAQQPGPAARRGQRLVRELPRRLRAALRERPRVPRHARARGHRAYIVPHRHHRDRSGAHADEQRGGADAGANNFFGYPPTAGTAQDCGPQNRAELRGNRELGYLAPPLYGVWATAPYLHNGSVPNVWEVLKPPTASRSGGASRRRRAGTRPAA